MCSTNKKEKDQRERERERESERKCKSKAYIDKKVKLLFSLSLFLFPFFGRKFSVLCIHHCRRGRKRRRLALEMKVIGETTEREGGRGPTVLVGVKFDGESKELLTWELVKVAQPGDHIIALHILDTATDNDSHSKSLVRLVSLRKSTRTRTLNLENGNCSVKSGLFLRQKTLKKNCAACASALKLPENSNAQLPEEFPGNGSMDNRLALVPFQMSEDNSVVVRKLPGSRPGWSLLRWVFLPKRHHSENSSAKKSVVQLVLKLPSQHSSPVVYPDLQNHSDREKNHSSYLDGENGAIVPVGYEAIHPVSFYQELVEATSNFMPENMVGKGGSSHVYKGCLPDGKELAVKIVKPTENAVKEFVQEIEIITSLTHKNLISLFGFCFEKNKLLLVYDFLSRGSLEENLHGNKKDNNAFGWQERCKVAAGIAEALDYLHNGCEAPVIHRDVKSSNVLLSDDFEPQLSDFGLASQVSSSASHMTCADVAGTFGKPIDNDCPKGQESLIMWAKPILKDSSISQLLDPHLGSGYDFHQIERMILAATLCIRRSPIMRPQISLILKLLQGDQEVKDWAMQQVRASEEVDIVDGEVYPTNIQSHLNLALLRLGG
ncbi:hypothetical protein CRYUN_Cryun17cG0067300 [Craigia yunnanensis]